MLNLQKEFSQISADQFSIICTISRSYDCYHVYNKEIHLIFSTFYTTDNRIQNSIKKGALENLFILTITSDDVTEVKGTVSKQSNIINLVIPYFYIVEGFKSGVDPVLNNILISIFGDPTILQKVFTEDLTNRKILYSYKNILLVFENLSWSNIQLLFKSFKISVSGGSQSKRHILSTSEYLLSNYLIKMKYTDRDVWESKKLEELIKEKDQEILPRTSVISAAVSSILIKKYLYKESELLTKLIKDVSDSIELLKSLQASGETELDLSRYISPNNKLFWIRGLFCYTPHFNEFHSIKSLKSPLKIDSLIDTFNQAISKIKIRLSQVDETFKKVSSFTENDLIDYYYKNIHNSRVTAGSQTLNHYLKLINQIDFIKRPGYLNMRPYSTLARRPLNSNNDFPNPLAGKAGSTAALLHSGLKLNNDLTKPTNKTNEKGNMGIATQTSIITKGNGSASSISYDFDSPIFRKLLSLLNEGVNKETQLQIEQLLQNQALEIATKKLDSQVYSTRQNSNHRLLILKLKEINPRLEKIINNYKTKLILMDSNLSSLESKIIYNVNTTFLISIMYGRLINIISNNQLLNNKTYQVEVTIDLGREIVNKYIREIYKTIKQSNPSLTYIQWKEENSSTEIISQTSESQFLFELGNLLINFMADLQLIKTEVKSLAKNEKKTILVAGPVLVKLIPELKTSFSIQTIPNRIPMVSPPKSYKYKEGKILELGGYLLNGEEYADEIILSNRELSLNSNLLEKNDIVNMINKINSVAFKINENVLDFILLNNHKYGFFTDINYVNPLNSKKKLTITEQKMLSSVNSRKHLELNILGLATIFRNVPSIYLPVRIDYRGRLYCFTEYLNYQGIELSKGLLEFSIGETVKLTNQEAINYLKIFGANCFGNGLGKKSFLDRIAWVDNNKSDIENFENGILLRQAENKTIFLSFCFEYKKYVEALNNHSSYFITNLPIQLDASCNGFQHLTLLVDDLALAKELNLNDSSWEDIPKDFYRFIGLKVQNYFLTKLEEYRQGKLQLSLEEFESYKKLAGLNIFRNLVKKAVMTIPYNASASSIIDYLKDNFDKKKNPEFESETELVSKNVSKENRYKDYYIYVLKSDISKNKKVLTFKEIDFKILRKALNFSIFVDYPKLTALAGYLKGIANVANKLEIQIPWYLPTGLIVNQQFYKTETIKIKPFAYNKNIVNLSVLNKTKFNKNKQKIALMPNLIHSLDAASLCLVIVSYFKEIDNINFYSIHDCFAVPCNKVNILTGFLKSAYCIIYSDTKYLQDFDTNFRSLITKTYGTQAVSFKEEGQITINLNNETISIKFPSISSVLQNKKSEIQLTNSKYLIH